MPRSHRFQVLTAALATLALAAPGRADSMPCPAALPTVFIPLVGTHGGVPASEFGRFQVVVVDSLCHPIPVAVVTVDLSFATDLTLCADQLDPSLTVDCSNKRVSATADAFGRAFFTLLGGSNGAGNATTFLSGGRIYANGTLIATPTVSAYDLDGVNGVSGHDLSAWLTDFASAQPFGRSDYDASGVIGGNDLSFWLKAFASGTQTASCAASCP